MELHLSQLVTAEVLGEKGECPPPLTVFTDMPADYKLGREF